MWKDWISNWFAFQFDHVYISYLPNKDRNEVVFDVEPWETEALIVQASYFGGATSYPSRGSYRKITQTGTIVSRVMVETTRMVTSFVAKQDLTEKALRECTDFLVKFKMQTNQESVAFVLDGEMFYL